jgi:hypothetical protein
MIFRIIYGRNNITNVGRCMPPYRVPTHGTPRGPFQVTGSHHRERARTFLAPQLKPPKAEFIYPIYVVFYPPKLCPKIRRTEPEPVDVPSNAVGVPSNKRTPQQASDAQTGAIVKLLPINSTHLGPGPMDDGDGLSSERSTPKVRARIVRQRRTQEGAIGPARRSGSRNGGGHWCRDTEKRTHHMNA